MTLQRALVHGLPPITCATYGVMIVDKVTGTTVARLPEVGWDLTYDYRIDRTSEAQLTVNVGPGGVGTECCAQLGRVGHWMHELVVYRQGSNREVWGGPITKLREAPGKGQFTIQAKDRSAWWWRRALPYDLTYSGGSRADATRVFMDLLRAAEQTSGTAAWKLPYDPVRLNVSGRETGVIVDGKVLTAADIVMIGPEIQTLSDSVIDWTVIGRTCYVGSLVIELDPLPILAQDHWLELDPEIEWDGETVCTQAICMGARGIMGIWPLGPISHQRWPQYGSHTLRVSDPKITDQATATERARTLWELHQQPALCVLSAGGSLGPNAPVIPQDLVPGRVANVGFDTSCFITGTRLAQTRVNGVLQYVAYDSGIPRDLVVPQRITKTTVTVEDSQETSVLVDLQPPGTADVRRPGGRSERQPVHIPVEPPPVEEECPCCRVIYWDDPDRAAIGGPTSTGASDHPGGCLDGDFVRLRSTGDFIEFYVNAVTDTWESSPTDLFTECLNRGEFAILGQQYSDGTGLQIDLIIDGSTFATLSEDGTGFNLKKRPTSEEGSGPWQHAYYNGPDIAALTPFSLGPTTVRLEVVNIGDADYAEIQAITFGIPVSEGGCLVVDAAPCYTCTPACTPFES